MPTGSQGSASQSWTGGRRQLPVAVRSMPVQFSVEGASTGRSTSLRARSSSRLCDRWRRARPEERSSHRCSACSRPARVIHAVGPRYRDPDCATTLQRAYQSALAKADEVGARSVAFPSISTGGYGYPMAEAAILSAAALRGATSDVERVVLVAFGRDAEHQWRLALDEVAA